MQFLLLEDSPLDADLITERVNSEGLDCSVRCVQKRDEFISALQEGKLDLILSDYSLPTFDGIEALDLALEIQPNVPFVFVSGYLGEDRAIETLKRGATDYVLKDRLERLGPSVKRALREAKERDERRRIETTLHILSEASLVLSSLDYSTTLSHVVRLAVPHFADYCMVDVVNEDGSIERVAVAHADPEQELIAQELLKYPPSANGPHPIDQVIKTGESQLWTEVDFSVLQEITHDAVHLETLKKLGLESCMLVPLLVDGQALGVMSFVSASSARRYEAFDLSLADGLARRCALAIENARLHRKSLDALRARDEFLAVLSHELRSPLTSILGWIRLLQEGGLDEEMQSHGLQVIERNTKTQVQLIQDLLEVSRVITGRLRLEMASVALSSVLQNAIQLVLPTAQAKGVEIGLKNDAASDLVSGDEPRLQQVFWNLISNALKFTPTGGTIEITLRGEDDFVDVEVRDNGEGIDSQFLPFVFDRFRQANSTSTRQHGGLGLGLAIVRHLTEMHGGTVQARSDGPGKGASFTVHLPLRSEIPALAETLISGQQTGRASAAIPQVTASLQGLKVLLVEDGDDSRELVSAILRQSGAEVEAVASVEAAMDKLGSNVPDVLLSDIGMPDQDGYDLVRRLKDWEEKHRASIPAVALTAYASEQDHARALSAGFQAHLTKPVEPELLVATLARVASLKTAVTQAL